MAAAPPSASLINRSGNDWLGVWTRFWFKPADPIGLGFLRIAVGMLILYTHIIYSFDLFEFFGKDGWHALELANARRREQPWVYPANDWPSEGRQRDANKPYEFEPANYGLPDNADDRRLQLVQ